MENCNCSKQGINGCIIEVIISVILGIIVGVLFANSIITATIGAIIVALVIALVTLLILIGGLYVASFSESHYFGRCVKNTALCLLLSAIGGLITGIIALIVSLATITVASILIISFIAFFFIWNLLSIASLVICLVKGICD